MVNLSHQILRITFTRSSLSLELHVVVVLMLLLSITTILQGVCIYEFSPFLVTEEAPTPCEVMRSAEDEEDQCMSDTCASPLDNGNVHEPLIEDECARFLITEEAPPPCEAMRSVEDIEDQRLPGIMASPLGNGSVHKPTIEEECTTGE